MLLFVPPYCCYHNDSGFRLPPSWLRVTTSGAVNCGDVTFSVAGSLYQRNIRRWHVKIDHWYNSKIVLLSTADNNFSQSVSQSSTVKAGIGVELQEGQENENSERIRKRRKDEKIIWEQINISRRRIRQRQTGKIKRRGSTIGTKIDQEDEGKGRRKRQRSGRMSTVYDAQSMVGRLPTLRASVLVFLKHFASWKWGHSVGRKPADAAPCPSQAESSDARLHKPQYLMNLHKDHNLKTTSIH